ncbi:hypothetical protein L210DRAFT_803714, partial [Boletus edulis BED1]
RNGESMRESKFHLGPAGHHTVFEGEEVGMVLATELLREEQGAQHISLALDNMAAIQAAKSLRSGAGHYLMDFFHSEL